MTTRDPLVDRINSELGTNFSSVEEMILGIRKLIEDVNTAYVMIKYAQQIVGHI